MPTNGSIKWLAGIDLVALGIPSEEEYVARYCERMGLTQIDNWPFYLALSFFRLAAIVQGVKKRALDGNASSDKAMEIGALVKPLTELAVDVIEL